MSAFVCVQSTGRRVPVIGIRCPLWMRGRSMISMDRIVGEHEIRPYAGDDIIGFIGFLVLGSWFLVLRFSVSRLILLQRYPQRFARRRDNKQRAGDTDQIARRGQLAGAFERSGCIVGEHQRRVLIATA